MANKIPAGITPDRFMEIRGHLKNILNELLIADASEVHMRLNKTGEEDPSPVFVGWVENDSLEAKRVEKNLPDPGLYRFGDDIYAKVYKVTISDPDNIHERHWDQPKDWDEKGLGEKALSKEAEVNYQRSIAITVGGADERRSVGALIVGFHQKSPDAKIIANIDTAIKKWAQGSQSTLVAYLLNNFEFGGPTAPFPK